MNWDWDKLQEKRQRQTSSKGPFNSDGNNNGNNNNNNNSDGGKRPPDGNNPFDKLDLKKMLPKFSSGVPLMPVIVVLVVLWLASGIFTVSPGQVAVITQFGKYNRTVAEGLHYCLPFPIESRIIVQKEVVRTETIGQATESNRFKSTSGVDESGMFTKDENLVLVQFNVQYVIDNAEQYLFNVKDPAALVRVAAEAAMRETIGSSLVDDVISQNRLIIQTNALNILQETLNAYRSGVTVRAVQLIDVQPPTDVADAFRDVVSAREEKQKLTSEAQAYRNSIVPEAEGTAAGIINSATAYKETIEMNAKGEAQRFLAMVKEYNEAKDITVKRLRFEALQSLLSSKGIDKLIISKGAKEGGFLPFLNLDPTVNAMKAPHPSASSSGQSFSGQGK